MVLAEAVEEAVGFALVPIVLLDVLDDVHSAWLQAVLEEVLEGEQLVVRVVRPVVDYEVQIA